MFDASNELKPCFTTHCLKILVLFYTQILRYFLIQNIKLAFLTKQKFYKQQITKAFMQK